VDPLSVGDVLVVGAGFSGLLAAHALVQAGFRVTLVEEHQLGGGQSAHSHGYLHRGYIYLRPTDSLVRLLQPAALRWESMLATSSTPFETVESLIGFESGREADEAFAHWGLRGLRGHRRVAVGDAVSGVGLADSMLWDPRGSFAVSPEKTVDFSRFARFLVDRLEDKGSVIRGRAVRLVDDGRRLGGVVVRRWGAVDVRLSARAYVIAAGAGSRPLVVASGRHPGPLEVRQSYMLCLRHPRLPAVSAIFPGDGAAGLFMAPRRDEQRGQTVWLVSNHVSYAGLDHSDVGARLWLRHLVRTLRTRASVFELDGLEWAYYPACKAEARSAPVLGGPVVTDLGWDNVAVVNPTKLTLVPPLVDSILRWVEAKLPDGGAPVDELASMPDLPETVHEVAGERWRACVWQPASSLLDLAAAPMTSELPAWR
jgi:glycine/D-amino acid oxidase-like deaminating enzyme